MVQPLVQPLADIAELHIELPAGGLQKLSSCKGSARNQKVPGRIFCIAACQTLHSGNSACTVPWLQMTFIRFTNAKGHASHKVGKHQSLSMTPTFLHKNLQNALATLEQFWDKVAMQAAQQANAGKQSSNCDGYMAPVSN